MAKTPTVTLGIGGAPYQKTLVPALLREGMLRRKLNPGPYLEIQDPGPDGVLQVVKRFPINRFANRLLWGVWRRLPKRLYVPPPQVCLARLADQLWSRCIPPCRIFHSWMGDVLASIPAARRQGALTLIENPGRHVRCWHQVQEEEYARFGIKREERAIHLSLPLIRRMEREYDLCDCIVVPSTISKRSFDDLGFGDKAAVVLTGVDTQFHFPQQGTERRSMFRVCFVGRIELPKGLGYLLQAWKRLALPDAELVLVGEVKTEMSSLLRTYADSTVHTTGVLPPHEVAACYRDSNLFVMPSVNEGLAQVLLEAMASGLPAVATDMTGAVDCMENGKEGIIVPARNADALADAILWCYQHPEESRAMGQAARARIEGEFTLEHYNQRIIALYRSLAA